MFEIFYNKYFDCWIELSSERWGHIIAQHPEIDDHQQEFNTTALRPEFIKVKSDGEIILSSWHPRVLGGKYIVIVVLNDVAGQRLWIVTAYISRTEPRGDLKWKR